MDLLHILSIRMLCSFLLFNCLYEITNSNVTLANLKILCIYGLESWSVRYVPAGLCTAKGAQRYSGFFIPDNKNDVEKFTNGLPYVLYYDRHTVSYYNKSTNPKKVDKLINKVIKRTEYVNVVIFSITINEDEVTDDIDKNFQTKFFSFLKSLKLLKLGLLVGLELDKNVTLVNKVFDLNELEKYVDLYVIDTTGYNRCLFKSKQNDIINLSPVNEMNNSMVSYIKNSYPKEKLFLTVTICPKRVDDAFLVYAALPTTYDDVCKSNVLLRRRYCRDSLQELYEKGKIVFNQGLAGVVINAVDFDDNNDNCNCGKCAGALAVKAGVEGTQYNTCPNFGLTLNERISSSNWLQRIIFGIE